MKTQKVIKTTFIIQGICCLIWLILLLNLPSLVNLIPDGGIKNVLAVVFTAIFTATLILPVGPVCLAADIIALCREKKRARRRRRIGGSCGILLIIFGLVSVLWLVTFYAVITRAGV